MELKDTTFNLTMAGKFASKVPLLLGYDCTEVGTVPLLLEIG